MTERAPVDVKNLDIYGSEPLPWSRAREQLERSADTTWSPDDPGSTYWLATVRPDGRPHVAAVGALWIDESFYFTSGADTLKSRNLAESRHCVISVALPGLDLVVAGVAAQVTDEPTLQRLAERYAAQGWPATVDNGAFTAEFSAPSAGPPPWDLYQVVPTSAVGVATAEPQGATRWQFTS